MTLPDSNERNNMQSVTSTIDPYLFEKQYQAFISFLEKNQI